MLKYIKFAKKGDFWIGNDSYMDLDATKPVFGVSEKSEAQTSLLRYRD